MKEARTHLMQIAIDVRKGLGGSIEKERTIYMGKGDLVMFFCLRLDGKDYSIRISSEEGGEDEQDK